VKLANYFFGHDGWSSEVVHCERESGQENGKWVATVVMRVRVTVVWTTTSSSYHEGTGYGGGKPQRTKGEALEGAYKEAETDAFKRALKNFGEAVGNCLYDKDYLAYIETVRNREGKFDGKKQFAATEFMRKPLGSAAPRDVVSGMKMETLTQQLREAEDDMFDDDEVIEESLFV
jgi:DNA repair and recombination protein RAD52